LRETGTLQGARFYLGDFAQWVCAVYEGIPWWRSLGRRLRFSTSHGATIKRT